ncbi:MAG TPA: helix-turn-helix transcriptional regulator [Solirubrobacteraceae bacterium]|nr:helix-turn-helix transcriptional regulator [Solirubrobacteraceae bacterium]
MAPKYTNPALSLGEIIRRQRELSELSMRQFASMAGISNPYLSQIERGLREPSDKVMAAIAEALQTSADNLYAQAGLDADDAEDRSVLEAIQADPRLTAAQRRALVTTYEGFLAANGEPRRRRRRERS